MNQNDSYKDIDFERLSAMSLGTLINELSDLLARNPWLGYGEQLDDLASNYSLMKDYMQNGFNDNMRDDMYADMVVKAKRMFADSKMKMLLKQGGVLAEAAAKANGFDASPCMLLANMQAFVQDLAMASIGGTHDVAARRKSIYSNHQDYLDKAFCAIVTSLSWSSPNAKDMAGVVNSPTIDSQDAQLLTSAIMLGSLFCHDINKVRTLAMILQGATDERVRQRALVGLVFAAMECSLYAKEVEELFVPMLADRALRGELLEMAIQMVYCNNAERDNEFLERNVIPGIMKNRNIDISKGKIVEIDENSLDDVLHPDETDKKVEELEKSMRTMMEMQKSGADIYFGGFKQMKRFAFFYKLSNWFMPFTINHPAFSSLSQDMKDSPLLKVMFASNSFCDNDKYSLVLSLMSVFAQLPANIKEAVPSELVQSSVMEGSEKATQIRRSYLQDLYRFFKVYPQRGIVADIFAKHPVLYGEIPFRGHVAEEARSFVKFMVKRGQNALPLMLTVYNKEDFADNMLLAYIYMKKGEHGKAYTYYNKAYAQDPQSQKALKGVALTAFLSRQYDTANIHYEVLVNELGEKSLLHQLYHNLALVMVGKKDEAVANLFRLSFDYDGNTDVVRSLALSLAMDGKIEQAIKYYSRLVDAKVNSVGDNRALGYCYARNGEWTKAVDAMAATANQEDVDGFFKDFYCQDIASLWGMSSADADILNDMVSDREKNKS